MNTILPATGGIGPTQHTDAVAHQMENRDGLTHTARPGPCIERQGGAQHIHSDGEICKGRCCSARCIFGSALICRMPRPCRQVWQMSFPNGRGITSKFSKATKGFARGDFSNSVFDRWPLAAHLQNAADDRWPLAARADWPMIFSCLTSPVDRAMTPNCPQFIEFEGVEHK